MESNGVQCDEGLDKDFIELCTDLQLAHDNAAHDLLLNTNLFLDEFTANMRKVADKHGLQL